MWLLCGGPDRPCTQAAIRQQADIPKAHPQRAAPSPEVASSQMSSRGCLQAQVASSGVRA